MESSAIFEQHRRRLFRLAYSMLERIAPAEDAVQEAYLRWQKQNTEQIRSPSAFLTTTVTRICLDELKAARNHREQYIGPDLPEPVVTAEHPEPDQQLERTESLSMAVLTLLHRLSPTRRAVYVLRELFDFDHATIAGMLDISEAQCRKIAQRAREQLADKPPVSGAGTTDSQSLLTSFMQALQNGNSEELIALLTEDAVLYSDGGGKVTAARKPVTGARKITDFLLKLRKNNAEKVYADYRIVNGEPGLFIYLNETLHSVWVFHMQNNGIRNIYVILNPDKLSYLTI